MDALPQQVRPDFPILDTQVNGRPLAYLDNAATTQVPEPVLAAMAEQYRLHQANVHRGIHTLSERSTARMEGARETLRAFLNAREAAEIVFTSGATHSINLVARALSFGGLGPGDEIVTTAMEHHANLIPWQEACRRTGAALRVVPLTPAGDLDLAALGALLSPRTRLVAVTCVSNVTGAVNPVEEIIGLAHRAGAPVLLDAAQAMRHRAFDVQALDCDFLCFSGHKLMGPTGTGVLYGKRAALEALPPDAFGGGMVDQVSLSGASWGELPFRLEAGTPNIVGNIGLAAAVDYLTSLGLRRIAAWEQTLLDETAAALERLPRVRILGRPARRAGAVSFNLEGCHCYDAARLLDQLGVAVRSGHHCAQPLLDCLGETGAVRVSPAFYNTREDIARLLDGLERVSGILGRGRRT